MSRRGGPNVTQGKGLSLKLLPPIALDDIRTGDVDYKFDVYYYEERDKIVGEIRRKWESTNRNPNGPLSDL